MKRGTTEYDEYRKEICERANEQLAQAYATYSLEELRWDWGCNITPELREILEREVRRRGVSIENFRSLGRGIVHA